MMMLQAAGCWESVIPKGKFLDLSDLLS
jgi:hypothetical protein